jgi:hypothetical protein
MIVGVDGKLASAENPGGPSAPHLQDLRQQNVQQPAGPTAPHQQDLRQQNVQQPAVAVALPVVAPVVNMNTAMAVKPPAFTNQWSSGMCNCCVLGCGTCCRACFCPCMVVGEVNVLLPSQPHIATQKSTPV